MNKSSKKATVENTEEAISRSEAIKKVGKVTLTAGAMLTVLSSKQAVAASGERQYAPARPGRDFDL